MNELYQNELISKIAGSIGFGMVCFVNADTLEMEEVPRKLMEDPEEYEAISGNANEMIVLKHRVWERSIRIDPMDSNEVYRIMEDFIESVPDQNLRQQLMVAISHKNPSVNFKHIIDNSAFRRNWIHFKQQYLEDYAKDQINLKLRGGDELDFEEIDGFYDDDGNKVDPGSVPMRSLCAICKKHNIENWEANLQCLMNRYDQRDEPGFKCGAFERM